MTIPSVFLLMINLLLLILLCPHYDSFRAIHLPRGIIQQSAWKVNLQNNNRWAAPGGNNKQRSNKEEVKEGITYTIELPRGAGIDWGSDLSFRWIYVQGLDPNGEAAKSGKVQKGDYIIGAGNTSLIAQDFDFVLTTLSRQPSSFNYTFFRGSKTQLTGEPDIDPTATLYTIKVIEEGKPDRTVTCTGGSNLRNVLVNNGINVYRSITRWTNCSGKQRCGTCIVEVQDGLSSCTRQGLDEAAILRENPETYRLSCVTEVYGDVTVQVLGKVSAAQWTR